MEKLEGSVCEIERRTVTSQVCSDTVQSGVQVHEKQAKKRGCLVFFMHSFTHALCKLKPSPDSNTPRACHVVSPDPNPDCSHRPR